MDERQTYEPLEIEVIVFEMEDIILTSDPPVEGPFVTG